MTKKMLIIALLAAAAIGAQAGKKADRQAAATIDSIRTLIRNDQPREAVPLCYEVIHQSRRYAPDAWSRLLQAYVGLNDADSALYAGHQALLTMKQLPENHHLAFSHIVRSSLASIYIYTGDTVSAEEVLAPVQSTLHMSPDRLHLIAMCYDTIGCYDKAISYYSRELAVDSTSLDALYARGFLYDMTGRDSLAELDLLAALELDDRNPGAYAELIMFYVEHDDYAGAAFFFVQQYRTCSLNIDFFKWAADWPDDVFWPIMVEVREWLNNNPDNELRRMCIALEGAHRFEMGE